ncbi:hypothetical protein F53441_6130 [Fusarium austroafricanum]|uniref:Uncharacterized protein n=1 Tax=Fusarium austroafricanum TaxID=2364996 RepID=A0A8H4NYZ1_9HYPO|nr:hypothetical protein F53441_6130 [Fusarium austroafricanum]
MSDHNADAGTSRHAFAMKDWLLHQARERAKADRLDELVEKNIAAAAKWEAEGRKLETDKAEARASLEISKARFEAAVTKAAAEAAEEKEQEEAAADVVAAAKIKNYARTRVPSVEESFRDMSSMPCRLAVGSRQRIIS